MRLNEGLGSKPVNCKKRNPYATKITFLGRNRVE